MLCAEVDMNTYPSRTSPLSMGTPTVYWRDVYSPPKLSTEKYSPLAPVILSRTDSWSVCPTRERTELATTL